MVLRVVAMPCSIAFCLLILREHHSVLGTVLGAGEAAINKIYIPPPPPKKNPAFMEFAI